VPIARSRITGQGQISVPAEIRRKLGVGPGSVLEWELDGDKVIVRRAGKYGWDDLHKALFPKGPPPRRSLAELKAGIHQYIRNRHARGRY
jgi:AbrB family looped-hinge helix DNA binding protein